MKFLNWLMHLFQGKPSFESGPAKFRMVPDEHGKYNLEKWDSDVGLYLTEVTGVKNQAEANYLIANLNREIIQIKEQ